MPEPVVISPLLPPTPATPIDPPPVVTVVPQTPWEKFKEQLFSPTFLVVLLIAFLQGFDKIDVETTTERTPSTPLVTTKDDEPTPPVTTTTEPVPDEPAPEPTPAPTAPVVSVLSAQFIIYDSTETRIDSPEVEKIAGQLKPGTYTAQLIPKPKEKIRRITITISEGSAPPVTVPPVTVPPVTPPTVPPTVPPVVEPPSPPVPAEEPPPAPATRAFISFFVDKKTMTPEVKDMLAESLKDWGTMLTTKGHAWRFFDINTDTEFVKNFQPFITKAGGAPCYVVQSITDGKVLGSYKFISKSVTNTELFKLGLIDRPPVTAVVYIHEKNDTATPSEVKVGIDLLNMKGIRATMIDDDITDKGTGKTPAQYEVPIAAARAFGTPCLVVMGGNTVIRIVKDPRTSTAVTESIE